MCCTGWVKRKGIQNEESGTCYGVFEGNASVQILSENSVAKSEIRDGFLSSCNFL